MHVFCWRWEAHIIGAPPFFKKTVLYAGSSVKPFPLPRAALFPWVKSRAGIPLGIPRKRFGDRRGRFFRLDIHDIEVGFSLQKLIYYKGGLSRSISKLILIRPEAVLFLSSSAAPILSGPVGRSLNFGSILGNLPVDQMYVRNGTVRLVDKTREEFVLSEELSGNIKARPERRFIRFARRPGKPPEKFFHNRLCGEGRAADPYFQCVLTRQKSEIDSLGKICSAIGDIGWSQRNVLSLFRLRRRDGIGRLDPVARCNGQCRRSRCSLTSLNIAITLLRPTCRIDSLKGAWNGISCKGSGR